MNKKVLPVVLILLLALLAAGVFFSREAQDSSSPELLPAEPKLIQPEPAASVMSGEENFVTANSFTPLKLPNANITPPKEIRAIYLTSWSAGTESKIRYLFSLVERVGINAVVIDIKDYSGILAYDTSVPEAATYGAESRRIADVGALLKRLHAAGIYVIGRMTVFQDPILANARPELAVMSTSSALWFDNKGLAWLDPAAREVWDYHIAIARDALERGFDEINFDYIRFPSDGNLAGAVFPFWNRETQYKRDVIRAFFAYLRENLPGVKLSADLFGLTTVNQDGLGVGQIIEDAYDYFDAVAPMVYPSHYASGFLNLTNPAEYPYQVITYSMTNALLRLVRHNLELAQQGKEQREVALRPWLQDFDLGADYNAEMVASEIVATRDALGEFYTGFMLWSPSNIYTAGAIINH